ncbi:MAG: hypothetical protein RLY57_652 [Candidatus Parcubacteria bacterium]
MIGIKGVQQEITWLMYENGETGIKFYYPPGTSVSEYSYTNENGAVFSVDVYDPVLHSSIFNGYLESSSCAYSGIKGEKVTVASTTFDHFTDDYGGDVIYDRYKVNKNGGCYNINLSYLRNNASSKEKAENILKSIVFTSF